MAFSPLGSLLNRVFRNELNRMLEELYSDLGTATGTKNKLDNFLAGTGVVSKKMLASNSVDGTKIEDSSIFSNHMRLGAIGERELATGGVTSTKIRNGAVSEIKLEDGAVSNNKIADGAITYSKLGDASVYGSNLSTNSVSPSKIADNAIGSRHILNTVVSREKLSNRFLFNGRIPVDNPIENVVNDGTYIVTGGNSGIFPEGESSASAWGMNVEVVNVNWVYQTIYKLDKPDIRYLRVKDNLKNIAYDWKKVLFHSEENEQRTHKKILMIGNSFTLNATQFVTQMCAEQNVDVTIGILYKSGETLENHLTNVQSNDAVYTYYERTSINGVTNSTTHTNFTFSQAVERNEWEYINFQQRSSASDKYETYQPFLTDLKSFVETSLTQTVNFGVLQTWALSSTVNPNQQEAYTSIVGAYRQAMIDSDLSFILPAGTAIQNARSIAVINAINNELTEDGSHLSELGKYIASASVFESLFRGHGSVEQMQFKPSTVNNYQRYVASKVSSNSVDNPERITEL